MTDKKTKAADQFLPTRRTALIAVAAFGLSSVPAFADEGAQAYIAAILSEANQTVFSEANTEARLAAIDALVNQYVDLDRVGRFALGQYSRVASDAQINAYMPLFKRYAKMVYRDSLSSYSGEALEVTGSVARSDRDIIVNSRVKGAKAGDRYAATTIHWRVYRGADGSMSVFDAGVDGVWLAVEQQSQFKSVIANNGGGSAGIDALIADLRAKTGA